MFIPLALLASVTALAGRPDLPDLAPHTPSAQLLQALSKAEDDFASIQRELGLVGSAPMAGLEAPTARPAVLTRGKAPVRKASLKTRRPW